MSWLGGAAILSRVALAALMLLGMDQVAVAKEPAAIDSTAGFGTVAGFIGGDRLLVQDESGGRFLVQYIGVRGPVSGSLLNAEASALHGPLVMGQRVRLESEGRDQEGTYRLRHVFLGDETVPIAARLVRAGWARSVPYPAEHRFWSVYQQQQEQAVNAGEGLWRPDVLGPAIAWRPDGQSGPGYVVLDPRLQPQLEALSAVPTGSRVVARLVQLSAAINLKPLPEGLFGAAENLGLTAEINERYLSADPRDLASVIGHEGNHMIDFAANAAGATAFDCVTLEIRAFTIGAQIWAEFFGQDGKPQPVNVLEAANNEVLARLRRGDLEHFVRLSTGYKAQCAGRYSVD